MFQIREAIVAVPAEDNESSNASSVLGDQQLKAWSPNPAFPAAPTQIKVREGERRKRCSWFVNNVSVSPSSTLSRKVERDRARDSKTNRIYCSIHSAGSILLIFQALLGSYLILVLQTSVTTPLEQICWADLVEIHLVWSHG